MAMDRRSSLSVPALLALALFAIPMVTACSRDSDDDGLSNKEEKELGLDPDVADSDGDGLNDGDEIEFGSDPLNPDADEDYLLDGDEKAVGSDPNNPDTDDDGYLDGDEFIEGVSPIDANSRIYKGNWPYNHFKDDIGLGKVSDRIEVGKRMPRFVVKDQHGDTVDLYDFAGQGKMTVLDLSAFNCPPCVATAEWLDTGDDAGLEAAFGDLRQGINDGEVYWLTVAYTSFYSPSESSKKLATDWANEFPNTAIPVLGDTDMEIWDYAYDGGMPFFALLDDQMVVQSFDLGIGAGVAPLEGAQDSL